MWNEYLNVKVALWRQILTLGTPDGNRVNDNRIGNNYEGDNFRHLSVLEAASKKS